jgi:hypothetical protein
MSPKPEDADRRRAKPEGDRRSPHTSTAPDGTLIFGDRDGGQWHVYDRRSGDRRGSRILGQASAFDRIFVNEAGEEWLYELRAEELIDETAFTLERQLANAVRRTAGDPR